MKKKDFTTIYDEHLEYHVNSYAIKVEELYKKLHLEGSAEIYAFNSCLGIIERIDKSKELENPSFSLAYRKLKKRGSLVRNNDLNVLYKYHIFPESQDLNIEMNEGIFEKCLNDFAGERASKLVYSWFSSWRNLYSMMFRLNDFSDFKLIRNSDFCERNDLFIKVRNRLYPIGINNKEEQMEENQVVMQNFKVKEQIKLELNLLYNELTAHIINSNKTSIEDFLNVIGTDWDSHDSLVHFKCSTQLTAYFFRRLEVLFDDLSYTTINKSKLFRSKGGVIIKDKNLSKSLGKFENKIEEQTISANEELIKNDIDLVIQEFIK